MYRCLTRNHVAILDVKIIVRAKDVTRNDRSKFSTMLLSITPVHYIKHPFCIAVAKVAVMGWSIVYLEVIHKNS